MHITKLLILFIAVLFTTLPGQVFQLEWEFPDQLTYVGDIDGDGIGEFVSYDENLLITKFYEVGNSNEKWTINGKQFDYEIFDAEKSNLQPDYLLFPSIDYNGDGKREVFFKPSDDKGIIIVDVVNNTTVFEWTNSQISYAILEY